MRRAGAVSGRASGATAACTASLPEAAAADGITSSCSPRSSSTLPTIRVNTSVVLVPTLVEKSSGEVVYGLKPEDFKLLDNGVQQKVRVEEDLDTDPVSLVICMERGRDAALEYDKFARLGPLLELFTGRGAAKSRLSSSIPSRFSWRVLRRIRRYIRARSAAAT